MKKSRGIAEMRRRKGQSDNNEEYSSIKERNEEVEVEVEVEEENDYVGPRRFDDILEEFNNHRGDNDNSFFGLFKVIDYIAVFLYQIYEQLDDDECTNQQFVITMVKFFLGFIGFYMINKFVSKCHCFMLF